MLNELFSKETLINLNQLQWSKVEIALKENKKDLKYSRYLVNECDYERKNRYLRPQRTSFSFTKSQSQHRSNSIQLVTDSLKAKCMKSHEE